MESVTKPNPGRRSRAGFTLIEILAVVLILYWIYDNIVGIDNVSLG